MRTDIVFLSTGILCVPMGGLPLNVKSVFSGTKGNFLPGEHFIVTSWITGAIWSTCTWQISGYPDFDYTRDRGLAGHNTGVTWFQNSDSALGFVWSEGVGVSWSVAQLTPVAFHIDPTHPKVVSKKMVGSRSWMVWWWSYHSSRAITWFSRQQSRCKQYFERHKWGNGEWAAVVPLFIHDLPLGGDQGFQQIYVSYKSFKQSQ